MEKRVYNRNKPLPEVPKELITTSQAIKLLGISDVTFHKYRKEYRIAPVGMRLNAYLYSRSDVLKLNQSLTRIF